MRPANSAHSAHAQQGMALLEVLISILIFSFGILSVVAMQANMVKHTSGTEYRTEASMVAQRLADTIMTAEDPSILATGIPEDISAMTDLPGAQATTTTVDRYNYTITLTWQAPGGEQHSYVMQTSTLLPPSVLPPP